MQKNITKSFIFLLFALMVFSSGCSRKREAIVLSEPERIASEEAAVQAGSSENAKAPGEAESSVKAEHSGEADARTDSEKTQVIDSEQAIPDTIMVHVCGAVLCEGVYELPTGSRVVDAVRAAGGFTGDADSDYINQALVLSDGVKVKIPTADETAAALQNGQQTADSPDQGSDMAGITGMYDDMDSSSKSDDGKVNINTADEAQLCTIPGIGPGRAKNIIAYREEKGRFGTIEDIMKVSGIKDKFFSKIKEYITV